MSHSHHYPASENYLDRQLRDTHSDIVKVALELHRSSPLSIGGIERLRFTVILDAVLHPHPDRKRIPLNSREFNPPSFLLMTLRQLRDESVALYQLCEEMARKKGSSAELEENRKLFSFLNLYSSDGKGSRRFTRRLIPRR